MKVTREFVRNGEAVKVVLEHVEADRYRVRIGDQVHEYEARAVGGGAVQMRRLGEDGAATSTVFAAGSRQQQMVRVDGRTHVLEAPVSRRGGGGAGGGDGVVRAPMTGTVLEVLCQPGDEVAADQTLVVVSAMKMEHKLAAGVAGVVQSVATEANATVDQGAELVVVEAKPSPEGS